MKTKVEDMALTCGAEETDDVRAIAAKDGVAVEVCGIAEVDDVRTIADVEDVALTCGADVTEDVRTIAAADGLAIEVRTIASKLLEDKAAESCLAGPAWASVRLTVAALRKSGRPTAVSGGNSAVVPLSPGSRL